MHKESSAYWSNCIFQSCAMYQTILSINLDENRKIHDFVLYSACLYYYVPTEKPIQKMLMTVTPSSCLIQLSNHLSKLRMPKLDQSYAELISQSGSS